MIKNKRKKEKKIYIYIINKKGKNEKERCQWEVLKAKRGLKWEIGLGKKLNFWNVCSLIILYFEFPRKTMNNSIKNKERSTFGQLDHNLGTMGTSHS